MSDRQNSVPYLQTLGDSDIYSVARLRGDGQFGKIHAVRVWPMFSAIEVEPRALCGVAVSPQYLCDVYQAPTCRRCVSSLSLMAVQP